MAKAILEFDLNEPDDVFAKSACELQKPKMLILILQMAFI